MRAKTIDDVLKILATDRGAIAELQWCAAEGGTIAKQSDGGGSVDGGAHAP